MSALERLENAKLLMNSLIDKEVFKSPLPDSSYIKSRKMFTQELPLSEDWDKDKLKLSYLF